MEKAENDECAPTTSDMSADVEVEAEALRRLNDAASRLWRTRNLQFGLEEMLAATMALAGANMGHLQIFDRERETLTIVAQQGFDNNFLSYFHEISTWNSFACSGALHSGECLIIEDIDADPAMSLLRSLAHAAGVRAVQCTPLIGRTGLRMGVITTYHRTPRRISGQELRLLALYARQTTDFMERQENDEELRQRAEELEAVIDAAPAFIWFGDADCRVIRGNNAANEMTGVTPGANVSQSVVAIGQAIYLRQLKQDGSEFRPEELPIQRAIATRRPVRDVYVDFRFPDGKRVEATGNAVPLFDANGGVRGGVAALIDISERNKAERELREHLETQAFLLRLTDRLRDLVDAPQIMTEAVEALGRKLGADGVGYETVAAGDAARVVMTEWTGSGIVTAERSPRLEDFGAAFVREMRAGRRFAIADVSRELAASEAPTASMSGVRAMVGAPIVKADRLLGVLHVQQARPRDWTEAEISLTQEVARRTCDYIDRAKALAMTRESR